MYVKIAKIVAYFVIVATVAGSSLFIQFAIDEGMYPRGSFVSITNWITYAASFPVGFLKEHDLLPVYIANSKITCFVLYIANAAAWVYVCFKYVTICNIANVFRKVVELCKNTRP